VLDTARELLGPEAVHAASHPIMASEDFSYVLQKCPARSRTEHATGASAAFPNHYAAKLVNESALANGIAMHVAVALRFLEKGTSPAASHLRAATLVPPERSGARA